MSPDTAAALECRSRVVDGDVAFLAYDCLSLSAQDVVDEILRGLVRSTLVAMLNGLATAYVPSFTVSTEGATPSMVRAFTVSFMEPRDT